MGQGLPCSTSTARDCTSSNTGPPSRYMRQFDAHRLLIPQLRARDASWQSGSSGPISAAIGHAVDDFRKFRIRTSSTPLSLRKNRNYILQVNKRFRRGSIDMAHGQFHRELGSFNPTT